MSFEAVIDDVKKDFDLLKSSNFGRDEAISTIKKIIFSYVTTGKMGYSEAVRVTSSMIVILSIFKEGQK